MDMKLKSSSKTILIVGAGFAGLNTAKELSKDSSLNIVIIDQNNYHLFQPLLYQVATGGLNISDITVPIRGEFSNNKNVEVNRGKVKLINLIDKFVTIQNSEKEYKLNFDYIVMACGAKHSYFGKNEWEKFAPGLKTPEQALEIRSTIYNAFELAEQEENLEKQKSFMTFVIVGGGPTGVELSGAIANICRDVLPGDFKKIDLAHARIILIEASPTILSAFGSSLSEKAKIDLQNFGVEVKVSTRVLDIDESRVSTVMKRSTQKMSFGPQVLRPIRQKSFHQAIHLSLSLVICAPIEPLTDVTSLALHLLPSNKESMSQR
jgi:NADH dehydrogenase